MEENTLLPPSRQSTREKGIISRGRVERTQRSEEPPVLPAGVSLLKHLLNRLLGVLPLRNLLERVGGDDSLEVLELERVSRGHQVVVVYHLDEGLDLVALVLAGSRHAASDLGRVALDAGYDGVAELVGLLAIVDGLKDDDLEIPGGILVSSGSLEGSSSCSPRPFSRRLCSWPRPPLSPLERCPRAQGRSRLSTRGTSQYISTERDSSGQESLGMGESEVVVYLLSGVPAPCDNGDTSDLEELHLARRAVVLSCEVVGCGSSRLES